jgi:hypothetical protein
MSELRSLLLGTGKFWLITLTLLKLASSLPGATLFDRGADWRWRPGTNEASTPTSAWRELNFNDTQFTSAPAPFWYDTTGDSSTLSGGTRIIGMQNVYLCVFLRKTFVITNLAEVGGLRLGSLVDDGFVAWINGTEVLRVSMPGVTGDPVTTSTLAINAIEPVSFATNTLPVPPSYLVPGTNVIAVQVFQSSLGSSDLGFDASLESVLIETNPPVVLSASPPAASTVTSLTQVTVTFSEPVTGVDAFDLVVNGSSAAAVTSVNSSTYTFMFPQPAYGTVQITWNPSHGIADQALPPNPFNANGPGAAWEYHLVDNTPPVMASLTPAASATVRSLTAITVFFSESVSGVDAADLLINNTPATGVIPLAPNQFTFTFPQPPTGAVQVAWASGHGIADLASVPNVFPGGSWNYELDPNAVEGLPYISEFMASNTRTLADEDGDYSDWIEIYNPSAVPVNLDGWSLTDNASNLRKWNFPATNVAGGGFLVVFASGKDRRVPGARLHTSFQLSAGGEYLALVNSDGNIASEFWPAFPPQVPDVSFGFAQFGNPPLFTVGANGVYFIAPTPGAANLGGVATPGPVIADVKHTPNVPLDDQNVLVTARIAPSFLAVASVTMRYRVMFDPEVTLTMFDDGAHGDGAAGDGIYAATIPANASTNGQMIRYYISVTDVNAHASRWPLYTDPLNTAQYLGTVVNPNYITSALPIIHLFALPTVLQPGPATSQIGADSQAGANGVSVFYDGEFYDNVYVALRGNTTAGYPKKSHRFEFNREHLFRHPGAGFGSVEGDAPRIRKTSFEADYPDPTYMRQGMSFWLCEQLGAPSSFYVPVRLQLNGQFYQLANHNDVHGEELLERLGYDPNGALYNAAGTVTPDRTSTGGFEKKTRTWDADADYAQLAAAIAESLSVGTRRTNIFDLLDLPEFIDYLVAARFVQENDDVWANMSLYHDNDGDTLWRVVPFDMNLSWGAFYYDNPANDTGIQATNDNHKSFPMYGSDQALSLTSGLFNRIYDVIFDVPQTREMYLRRVRTMLDTFVLPPGTPAGTSPIEQKIIAWRNLIATEAALDRAKWNWPGIGGQNNLPPGSNVVSGVNDLFQQFFFPRRQHYYGRHSVTNTVLPIGTSKSQNAGIPLAQPPNAPLSIVGVEFNPASANQDQEFICISNPTPFAVDLSGWKVDGGVQFAFAPGTVLPSNSVAYVSPDVRAFKARTTSPRGGQGLFVLGPYKGQLSARGETLRILNGFGQAVSSLTYTGAPSPAQQFLRITEIMYHPSPHAANTNAEEFEYIELKNISTNATLNLAGVRFTNGVEFNFTGGAITSLAPGARVLVVKNLAAFNARYGGGLPVAGQYAGSLENHGERIQLIDSSNEEILDFSYDNGWYPITDGLGFSLVIVDENAEPDAWDSKSQWRASDSVGGAPGGIDPAPPTIAPILVNEALTRTDNPPPTDSIELFNPTASEVNIGGWWLTDDFNTPQKFRIPDSTTIAAGGYRVFTEGDFNPGGTGFALSSDGDEVWLFSADAAGNLTGYFHGYDFGAADDGVSFGRYITSEGKEHFLAQSTPTLGMANSGPLVGPLVISEIMYHPPDFGSVSPGADNSEDEFIELLNIESFTVPLYDAMDSTNTWKLTGGVDFSFPANQSLAAGQFLLLVDFNPANAAQLGAFRAKYGVPTNVPIFGPYAGKLDNSGDAIELKKPTSPVGGKVPYVLVDKVSYEDSVPWPPGADGTGLSLQRKDSNSYGNDPANWTAAPPTAGALTGGGAAPVITVQPQNQSLVVNQNGLFSVTAGGAGPLRFQWRFNGTTIAGATNSILQLLAVQPAQIGNYDAVVFNNAGSVVSSNVTLTLAFPPFILAQPQSVQVRVRPDPQASPTTNASFGVIVFSSAPVTYQWRFNGADIPGALGSTLMITNVQLANAGEYTVAVSDINGTSISAPATLYPLVTPSIIQPPLSQSVVVGAPVTLSIAVTGSPLPITYEWRRFNAVVASNVVNSFVNFYSFTAPNAVTSVQYRVIVKNLAYTGIATNSLVTLTTLADSDGDGIPDIWESAYFGGATMASPDDDPDGDGMKNRQEYIAGTDPTDPLSYLRVDSLDAGVGTQLSFMAVSNRTYTVQFTDALGSSAWQRLTEIPARATNRIEFVSDPTPSSHRVYRLATPRVP